MTPLTMANTGETVTVRKITGKAEVRRHLAGLAVTGWAVFAARSLWRNRKSACGGLNSGGVFSGPVLSAPSPRRASAEA